MAQTKPNISKEKAKAMSSAKPKPYTKAYESIGGNPMDLIQATLNHHDFINEMINHRFVELLSVDEFWSKNQMQQLNVVKNIYAEVASDFLAEQN